LNFQHPAKPLGQLADRIAFASAENIIMLFSFGASAIAMPWGNSRRAPPPTRSASNKSSKKRWRRTASRRQDAPQRKGRMTS